MLHSVFFDALGRSILNSLWQMALLWLLYHGAIYLFRISSSWVRNLLATAGSLLGAGWFVYTLVSLSVQASQSPAYMSANITATMLPAAKQSNQVQLWLHQAEQQLQLLLPYLSAAYLFFLLVFAVKLLWQLKSVHQLRRSSIIVADQPLTNFFRSLCHKLGIRKPVELVLSNSIQVPAAIGYFKPLVLLPAAAVNHLTPAQLESVLLHELAHIKRNDYLWNILLTVAETLLFFNPFIMLLVATARRERENSCDDNVIRFQQDATVYAEALLHIEHVRMQQPQLLMALGNDKQQLLQRVKRILNVPHTPARISRRITALLLVTILFACLGWVLSVRSHQQATLASSATQTVGTSTYWLTSRTGSRQQPVVQQTKSQTIITASSPVRLQQQHLQTEVLLPAGASTDALNSLEQPVADRLEEQVLTAAIQSIQQSDAYPLALLFQPDSQQFQQLPPLQVQQNIARQLLELKRSNENAVNELRPPHIKILLQELMGENEDLRAGAYPQPFRFEWHSGETGQASRVQQRGQAQLKEQRKQALQQKRNEWLRYANEREVMLHKLMEQRYHIAELPQWIIDDQRFENRIMEFNDVLAKAPVPTDWPVEKRLIVVVRDSSGAEAGPGKTINRRMQVIRL